MNTLSAGPSSVPQQGPRVRGARAYLLGSLAVAGGAVCALAAVLASAGPAYDHVDRAVREALIVGVPILAGLYAARSPRDARFGFMLAAAGFAYSLTALAQSPDSLPYSIGRVAGWLVFPLLYYLMLAFPDGRLAPQDRRLFGCLAALITILYAGSALFVEAYPEHTPWATCGAACPPNAFLILDHEPAVMANVVQPLREALAVGLLVLVTASLIRRVRGATWLRRTLMMPLATTGAVSTVILIAFLLTRRVGGGGATVRALGTFWSLCIPAVAAAFLFGLLQRRMLVGSVLRRLSGQVRGVGDSRQLRGALALALGDPSVDLLIAEGAPGHWHDSDGRPASRSELMAQGRATTVIDDGGAPVAALVHDPALREDEELLAAVGSIVVAAIQHERLTADLRSSLGELEQSRSRIAAAADLERSRIERDLHDGAQQRLIKIRIGLSLAEELVGTDPATAAESIRGLGDEIEVALDELRELAHGVYPSLLSDRGLDDALRSLAVESPLPVHFDVAGVTRLPSAIETAVYFTCAEALQNANKHADGATRVWIALRQDRALRLRVRDDGSGFVPPAPGRESGLHNMRDRIEAAGGRLTIDASPGHGTVVRAIVPLPDERPKRRSSRRFRGAGRPAG